MTWRTVLHHVSYTLLVFKRTISLLHAAETDSLMSSFLCMFSAWKIFIPARTTVLTLELVVTMVTRGYLQLRSEFKHNMGWQHWKRMMFFTTCQNILRPFCRISLWHDVKGLPCGYFVASSGDIADRNQPKNSSPLPPPPWRLKCEISFLVSGDHTLMETLFGIL